MQFGRIDALRHDCTGQREFSDPDPKAPQVAPRPIVKWVGGKGRLLPELLARVPKSYGRYFEPFAGGAALFFALAPERAVLSDANAELIATYAMLRDETEDVLHWLAQHAQQHSDAHYYEVRNDWNGGHYRGPGQAAAFLYLNRVCFNGLWRVNKSGAFNVPIGDYDNPTICDVDAIETASRALARAELRTGDYRDSIADAAAGDFVYFDPPYDGMFASYTADTFGRDAQRTLSEVARDLISRGVHVLLSNSDTPFIRELYDGFVVEVVRCSHAISADGDGRGAVNELVISGGPGRTRSKSMSRQTEIPGAEDPNVVPEIEEAIYAHLDKCTAHRRAGDEKKITHQTMVLRFADHKRDSHPYTDPKTGKRKLMWISREPKAKSASSPSSRSSRPKRERRGGPRRDDDAVLPETTSDSTVEKRRVPRKSVEKEIDPFGATRTSMSTKPEPFNPPKAKPTQKRGKAKRGR